MKSQSRRTVIFASLLTVFWYPITAQSQSNGMDKPGLSQPETLVRTATAKKQIRTLIATAKTPANHRTIAEYFDQEANRMEDEANRPRLFGWRISKEPAYIGRRKTERRRIDVPNRRTLRVCRQVIARGGAKLARTSGRARANG
jgi:hypothetical protein